MMIEAKPQDRSAIADRFISVRRRMRLSQARLASYMGVCRQTVSKVENRRVLIHTTTWYRFCDYELRAHEFRIR